MTEDQAPPLSTFRKAFFYAILSFGVLAVPFLAVEAYCRVAKRHIDLFERTGRKPGFHPVSEWAFVDAFCAYRGQPGVFRQAGAGIIKSVNQYGYISTPELALEKPEGTTRIAFLGGSSTAGTAYLLSDRDTWPWQVVDLLSAAQPERSLEFINGALGGYSSFESYGRLWSRIRFFSPDVVIVNHGWNEMYYFDDPRKLPKWRTGPDGSWSFERPMGSRPTHRPWPLDPLFRHSQVLTRLRLKLGALPGGELGPQPARPAAAAPGPFPPAASLAAWRTNLRLIREGAAILGARLFVLKQPTLVVADLSESDQARCRYDLHGFGHEAHVEAYREIYRVIDEEIPPENIFDLTALSGRPELFFDHVHPTVEGAAEIARAVAMELSSRWDDSEG